MKAFALLGSFALLTMAAWAGDPLPRLRVSENHRFLETVSGHPFFYLGDTAWELFHRLNREEAIRYLDNRARKGFNTIQAVALGEYEGLSGPNAYGYRPLVGNDPTHPDVKDGPNNDYWDQVDFIVAEANRRGLYIGFLPTWGDKWNKKWGTGPEIFTPENAAVYGEWLGHRYRDAGIIWILGGDRPVENDRQKEIIRAMAQGLRRGDGGAHLITFHPTGGRGSAETFQNEDWLDFNMRQNGHEPEYNPRYALTHADYLRTPVKPVLDGEPIYEDHPVSFKAKEFGHSVAADVRRAIYWDTFGGACGHTYGNHAVWQMFDPAKHPPVNNPLMPWTEAIDQPGAEQMHFARQLLESRPYFSRIPDDAVIVPAAVPTAVPGAGTRRFVATRDREGSYAMVYVPVGRKFSVHLDVIAGPKVKAWWFDPRTGEAKTAGEFANRGVQEFTPPALGELLDWVLVLDDAARNLPPPGQAAL